MAKPIRGDDPFNILDLDDIPKPGRDIRLGFLLQMGRKYGIIEDRKEVRP